MKQLKLPFDFTKSDDHWIKKLITELMEKHGYLSVANINLIALEVIKDAVKKYEKY